MSFCRALCLLSLAVFLFSCKKTAPEDSAEQPASPGTAEAAVPEGPAEDPFFSSFPVEALIALIRPAGNPLWFEVSSGTFPAGEAPRHIQSPGEAALNPFTPWPLAPHVAAMLVHRDALYLAVNRDSLLVILPVEGGDLGLYRFAAGTDYWDSYTVGNLFIYEDEPALFFYRDDTFAEPAPAPPRPPVLGLRTRDTPPAFFTPLAVPALADIPFAEGWEADILRQGIDKLWYYRGIFRQNGGRKSRYFRGADLSRQGEEIGAGTYRSAQAPAVESGETAALPPLPENFVYSQVRRLGDFLFAAWEEQEDYSIGAAGFMVIRLPAAESPAGF
ncbi:MAG: hypothetical protein LBI94_02260 [Treponema sp.]|jgi:hypothetical protein|nr:hypothetical protein [Treponema sp.]